MLSGSHGDSPAVNAEAWDCVVIGAGPAGSCAAAVLGEYGRRVLVLEKETFPRYAIGESLVPYCYFPLERIGMIEKLRASKFPKKYSVQFVSKHGSGSHPFYFDEHRVHPSSQTWQVTRSEFDRMLMENAQEKGALVRQGTRVTSLIEEKGRVVGVRAMGPDGLEMEYRAQVVMDASGRNALSVARNRWRVPDNELKKIALWTYYEDASRSPGRDAGATTVAYVDEKNWFWYIPLADNRVSVGLVADRDYLYSETKDSQAIFEREIAKNEWISRQVGAGTRCDSYRVTSDFSYRSTYCAVDGLVLVGDAFAFLDPVFSTGILLALKSGELAADSIECGLREGDLSGTLFHDYGKTLCKGIESFRKLVYAFYDPQFRFRSFLENYPEVRPDLTDCLIGRLDRDYDTLFAAVSESTRLPVPLPYGAVGELPSEHSSRYSGDR